MKYYTMTKPGFNWRHTVLCDVRARLCVRGYSMIC
jgi:hypothetical protein